MLVTRTATRAAPAVFRAGMRTAGRPYHGPMPKNEQQAIQDKIDTPLEKDSIVPKTGPTANPKTLAQDAQTMTELASEKVTADTDAEKKAIAKKDETKKKLTLWEKVKHEATHYWDGTKLLGFEIKISSKLALKMAAGYELTRRERRQLQRTVQDLGRLIPFLPFVIVPFAELLLPVALKLFPNMLPSTYEGQSSKDAKAKRLRSTRKEVSEFLRSTLKETGLPISAENAQREEFAEFFRKVRTTGEKPTPDDIIKVCKIFKDDLTLDNLSRPQLVSICRYMNITSFGTDNFLRYQVRVRMRQIKRDDRAIAYEGVDSLSVPELQTACASRGLRTYGVSPGRLRDDLQTWLDLRLKHGVPSTILVLSNAFVYVQGKEADATSQIDALEAVLSSIPEELYHEIELEVNTTEGAATNKQRLEVLKEQQELIEEENEQVESHENKANASPKDHEDIDEDDKPKKADAEVGTEPEASSGDSGATEGSAERTEQDARARNDEMPAGKEAPKKE
ncbi:LETM1-domain-containing protein [Lizonia empirigonia]|nr:LETM1-domain-containing protein [Lizonia empirigonia]